MISVHNGMEIAFNCMVSSTQIDEFCKQRPSELFQWMKGKLINSCQDDLNLTPLVMQNCGTCFMHMHVRLWFKVAHRSFRFAKLALNVISDVQDGVSFTEFVPMEQSH